MMSVIQVHLNLPLSVNELSALRISYKLSFSQGVSIILFTTWKKSCDYQSNHSRLS